MGTHSPVGLRLRASVAALLLTFWCRASHAQNQAPSASTTLQEVVVTGTRVPGAETAVSPLVVVGAQTFEQQGALRIEDTLNRLPQVTSGQNINSNFNPTGTATVDLRGLGPQRTLVLLDGKRLTPGDPTSGSIAPDLNFVPAILLDRVEITTGGASAVYGSDAIAGVVNLITRSDYTGLLLEAQAGGFEHHNADAKARSALAAAGIAAPDAQVADGLTYGLDVLAGRDLADGDAHLTVYGGYRHTDPVTQATRDFSACVLIVVQSASACGGSAATAFGLFQAFDQNTGQFGPTLTLDAEGGVGALRPVDSVRDVYNSVHFAYFQRRDDRYTAGAFFRYRLSQQATLYANAMFMNDRTSPQLPPSALFGQLFTIACDNPMLSATEVTAFCGAAPAAGQQTQIQILRRNVEGDLRTGRIEHRDYRFVAGVLASLGPLQLDTSLQVSGVKVDQMEPAEISISRTADALDVVRDASGALVCASGSPGCAPYDLFRVGGVTAAAVRYLEAPAVATGSTGELVASTVLSGRLDGYDLKSPWAREGLGVALGAEYRRDSLDYSPNAEFASGDLSGAAASPAVSGAIHVYELSGELNAPLVQDQPGLHRLELDLGVRRSWYNDAGAVWTYKAAAAWAPTPDLTMRAGYDRAVRAPNVVDLFTPVSLSPSGLSIDPCAGEDPAAVDPAATVANCARTGLSATQYGHVGVNGNGYNSLEGGNANLRPETADTVTVGLVLTPRAAPSLRVTIDGFKIALKGAVTTLGADFSLQRCLATGDPFFCRLVHRDPTSGSLWLGTGYVSDVVQSAGAVTTRGVDFQVDYTHDLPSYRGRSLGRMELTLLATELRSYTVQPLPGGDSYDCAGLFGATCGPPLPHWRHLLSATWRSPGGEELTAGWRYIGGTRLDSTSSNPVLHTTEPFVATRVGSESLFDLSAAFPVTPRATLRIGVNNLFDRDPPVVDAADSGNTFPGLYDALGRTLFVRLTARAP